jgi:hypothetical protein
VCVQIIEPGASSANTQPLYQIPIIDAISSVTAVEASSSGECIVVTMSGLCGCPWFLLFF